MNVVKKASMTNKNKQHIDIVVFIAILIVYCDVMENKHDDDVDDDRFRKQFQIISN